MRLYSITSSARMKNADGKVRRRALAALRLVAVAHFVGSLHRRVAIRKLSQERFKDFWRARCEPATGSLNATQVEHERADIPRYKHVAGI
jgi:hypothetical protein